MNNVKVDAVKCRSTLATYAAKQEEKPKSSESTRSSGRGNAKLCDNCIHTYAAGKAKCPAKKQYAVHAKRKATSK